MICQTQNNVIRLMEVDSGKGCDDMQLTDSWKKEMRGGV
jgi:hypothetical protein